MQKNWLKKEQHRSHQSDDRFVEWVHRLGLEKSFIGRTLIDLEERFKIKRLSVLVIYSFVLALFLTLQLDFPYNVKLGEISTSDINSPFSFEIIDQLATEEKQYKAESSVSPVFDYDLTIYEKIINNVYKSFRQMRQQVRQYSWPKNPQKLEDSIKEFVQYKPQFEEAIANPIPDFIFEWLVKNKFSARLENMMILVLDDWLKHYVADNLELHLYPHDEKLVVKAVQQSAHSREFTIDRVDILDLQQIDEFKLEKIPNLSKLNAQDRDYLFRLCRMLMLPNITPNKQETALRRNSAKAAVMPVSVSVKKNQNIVRKGTPVSQQHIVMLKHIQQASKERKKDFNVLLIALLFVTIVLVFFSYVRRFTTYKVKVSAPDIQVMAFVALFAVLLTKVILFFTDAVLSGKLGPLFPPDFFLYLIPFATGPMLIGLLITSGEVVWLFTVFLASVFGLMVEMNFQFVLVSFVGGIAGARGVYGCKKRNDIYWAGLRTGLVNSVIIYLLMSMSGVKQESSFVFLNVMAGFLSGVFSSMIAMMIIPLLESLFNYTTDVRLLELSNLNHPLLKEMIVKAPGTYHHSMLIGTMVEAASEDIGANPLLAKVMSYYHDIGKMDHSHYFIENQKSGVNPHDTISPYMSKTILVAHVKDGVELGIKHKLGKPILDGIVQHHGTTLISFFYNKALDAKDDRLSEVSESEFRYPGPKPQFREAALVMLADSIEAAARSLDEPTPVRLQNIVKNIIQRKFMDGQLDECNLTLKDLGKVESSFVRTLLGIYHQRIDYPKHAGGGTAETPTNTFKYPTSH